MDGKLVVHRQPDKTRHQRRGGRAGQALEITFVDDSDIGIEPRQPQRGACHIDKGGQPAPAAQIVQDPFVHDQRGRHAERRHVGQRVILLTECRLRVGQASHPAIHAIQHHGHENGDGGNFEAIIHCLHNGIEPREQRSGGECVGQQVDASVAVLGIAHGKIGHSLNNLQRTVKG
ncbi:hypothetical protein D3C71_1639760 [compost metagenome]